MRAIASLIAVGTALLLSGCVEPRIEACNVPKACTINVCTTGNTCVAKPLELKGALP